ncbi:MAG: CheR family methyltransferase [Luteibaculaceae bacterium]
MTNVTDEELNSINRAILVRYGIDFTNYEPASFKRRLARAVHVFNMEGVHELWMRLLRDKDFIYELIDQLTVGLTDLFRNPELWIYLKGNIIPKISPFGRFTYWHAGCSTGEEVYTFSMVLDTMRMRTNAKGYATDINQGFIDKAKIGLYHSASQRSFEKNFKAFAEGNSSLEKFYTKTSDGDIQLDTNLLSNITFENQNLVSDVTNRQFELIFCRNVLIYFDKALQTKVLEKFANALKPGGYLVLGYYDTNPLVLSDRFKLIDATTRIYQLA